MKYPSKTSKRCLGWLVLFLVFVLSGSGAGRALAQNGTWTTKAPMPTARNGLSLGTHNGVIYAVGGWSGFHLITVEAYDTTTNTWSTKASMLGPQTSAVSGVIDGVLYLAGGTNCCVEINTFTAYDIATNSWTFKSSMPTTRQGAAGGVINGKLYVAGGINSQNQPNQPALAALEVFDPATNTWSSLPPMPTARFSLAASVVNGVLYVVGGRTGTSSSPITLTTTVEAFDPVTNTWTTKAPMPTARAGHAVAVVNGILYVIGGSDINGQTLNTVEAYNPVTNTWATEASMLTARGYLRAEPVGGTLYAVGGYGVAGNLSANEAFTPVQSSGNGPTTGTLQVTVRRSDTNAALAGASVSLSGPSTPPAQTTGSDGTTTFDTLQAGSYIVTVSLPGFLASSTTATVSANTTTSAAFSLTPALGTLTVTTTPVSGPIVVDGTLLGNGSISIQLPAGVHTVSFGAVSGFTTPSPQSVTIPAGQTTSVTGTYAPLLPQLTLTVLTIGTGSGTVTSSPAGIACGADCAESYPAGTVVTLTATANPGATFVRWRGHADCADGQVTLTVAKTCAAVFTTVSLPQLEDGRVHSTIVQSEPSREERNHPQTSPAPSH